MRAGPTPWDKGERIWRTSQPGFFNVDGQPNQNLVDTAREANRRILGSVRELLDGTSTAKLHHSYNETKAAYRRIMEQRFALLKKRTDKWPWN